MRLRTAVSCGSLLAEARRPFLPPASAARNSSPSGPRDNTSASQSTFFIAMKGKPRKQKKERKMNALTQFKKVPILPLLIVLALGALTSPRVARADAVTDWNLIASTAIVTTAAQPPPVSALSFAMVQGAVYDAVNAIDRGHQPYLVQP